MIAIATGGIGRERKALPGAVPENAVGPNAVTQLANALHHLLDQHAARRVFRSAGHESLLDTPPKTMIDETVPAALFTALWCEMPHAMATKVATESGLRTADYILEHRIPPFAKRLLPRLPASVAAWLLLRAIRANAWTFAGSGTCETRYGTPLVIEIKDNPLAMPDCFWHRGVFTRLFERLVHPRVRVTQSACCQHGDSACRFEIALLEEPTGPKP